MSVLPPTAMLLKATAAVHDAASATRRFVTMRSISNVN